MFRISICALIIVLLSISVIGQSSFTRRDNVSNTSRLDGVYEFVSESTILTRPRKIAYKRMTPDWTGVWQFQNGYYTRMLMKGRRDKFYNPKKLADLGFESFAGKFEIEGESVWLRQPYALNPYDVDRSVLMTFKIDGDILTLIENLVPYTEDLREGKVTIILKRLN